MFKAVTRPDSQVMNDPMDHFPGAIVTMECSMGGVISLFNDCWHCDDALSQAWRTKTSRVLTRQQLLGIEANQDERKRVA
jgi:hypothetical protein